MIGTPAVRNLIRENKIPQIFSSIQTGQNVGMQTMDDSLMNLVKRKVIDSNTALPLMRDKDMLRRVSGHSEG